MRERPFRLTEEHREILKGNPLYKNLLVEFRDGWFDLINQLGKDILELCDLTNNDLPTIRQVKEKFGTLRFYYSDQSTDECVKNAIYALVSHAENKSASICEKCGKYGSTVSNGVRVETVCKEHKEEGSKSLNEL